MPKSAADKAADNHTMFVGKIYHWARSKRNQLTLHKGLEGKCKRHHY